MPHLDNLPLAIGDRVLLEAEVRRLDHDGRVVTLIIPAVIGLGHHYIVSRSDILRRVEHRRGVIGR